jgi:hypothetical protein
MVEEIMVENAMYSRSGEKLLRKELMRGMCYGFLMGAGAVLLVAGTVYWILIS